MSVCCQLYCLSRMFSTYILRSQNVFTKIGLRGNNKRWCFCFRGMAPFFIFSLFCWGWTIEHSEFVQGNYYAQLLFRYLFSSTIIGYLASTFCSPGYLKLSEGLINFIKIQRSDLESSFNQQLDQPLVMRAMFCDVCERQVRKLQFHSIIELITVLALEILQSFQILPGIYFASPYICNQKITQSIHYRFVTSFLDYKHFIFNVPFQFSILLISGLPCLFLAGQYVSQLIEGACKNITFSQQEYYIKFFYLQNRQKQLYNPFDRGCYKNLIQFILPTLPCFIRGCKYRSGLRKRQRIQVSSLNQTEVSQIDQTNTTVEAQSNKQIIKQGDYQAIDMQNLQNKQNMLYFQVHIHCHAHNHDTMLTQQQLQAQLKKQQNELLPRHDQMHIFFPQHIYNWNKTNIFTILDVDKHPLRCVMLPTLLKKLQKKRKKREKKRREQKFKQQQF